MSIAQKQTREILDEDKNINKQVMERQIKQVTLTPEGYKSKRPIEGRVKYNVQRLINLFRLALENSIDVYNEGREKKDFSTVVETYNNLVNYANFFIKEENPSQNELSKLNDDLSKLNPLVDAVAQVADVGSSVDRNDMTELRNQWYADKRPIGLTEKGLSARLERTKKRQVVEDGNFEETGELSGAVQIEFQLQKLERFVNTLPNSDRKDTILKEIRALNKSFRIAQKEYYELINSEDPIQKNKKKQKYDNLVEDIVNMVNDQFDEAVINLLITSAHYGDVNNTERDRIIANIKQIELKSGIQLNIHKEFMNEFNKDEIDKIPKLKLEKNEIKCILDNNVKNKTLTIEQVMDYYDKLKEIKIKIAELKLKKKEYFLDNSKYIFDYFENKKDISKGNQTNNNKILESFFKINSENLNVIFH